MVRATLPFFFAEYISAYLCLFPFKSVCHASLTNIISDGIIIGLSFFEVEYKLNTSLICERGSFAIKKPLGPLFLPF